MHNLIFLSVLTLFLSLSITAKAHNSVNFSFNFSSEESNKNASIILPSRNSEKDIKPKSIEPKKHKISKEDKQIAKQNRKEFRQKIWKSLKENRKINKQNRKKGIKDSNSKIHWAAYFSFFGTLAAIGTIIAGLILKSAIFSFLIPIAFGLLIASFIASIIGIFAVANKETTLYHKSKTITLALIGGILALLSLLFIGFVILALSNMPI